VRDWRSYWRGREALQSNRFEDALHQVGKTQFGVPIDAGQFELIIESIHAALELGSVDRVVDLGCGNGLLTQRIAGRVRGIQGFDISDTLIETAKTYFKPENCAYFVSDLSDPRLGELISPDASKVYAYEVLQHLSAEEARGTLSILKSCLSRGFSVFAGSVPDLARIRNFYDTPERWRHYEEKLSKNEEQIGHWWRREELFDLCGDLGLDCEIADQNPGLYTADYRFNAVIRFHA
jgi:predicted TPR repeat methyltransferase